jgi:signal transduction histidine kinase
VATLYGIRYRLFTILVLGVITSVLSLVGFERAVATSASLRRQRGIDVVTTEVDRLATLAPSAAALERPSVTTYLGLRGGWDANGAPAVPAEWAAPVAEALAACTETHARNVHAVGLDGPLTLVVGAAPAREGGCAWVAYPVVPFRGLDTWRVILVALAVATVLLVTISIWAILSFRRSASALHGTLTALGKDLSTPVPEPSAAELLGIAGGIRALAAELSRSRLEAERLGHELAQKERLAALGRVAAGVAHEVRNPLASIKLRLDLTTTRHTLPAAAVAAVAAASDEIARLDRLVSDLLLVAGHKLGPRRAVALGELARTRVEALRPWAAERGVELATEGEGSAEIDAEAVARALDNLLRNGVEASPRGTTVTVRVGMAAGAALAVRVEDRGDGVAAAREAEIFEPFFTTTAEGTGLGLAISRAIARAHGGDLVYARADGVTRFEMTLPRAAAEERAA